MPEIAVLALPNAAGASLFGVLEIFSTANRILHSTGRQSHLFNTVLCSIDGEAVTSSMATRLEVTASVKEINRPDLIYIAPPAISSSTELLAQQSGWGPILDWLRACHEGVTLATHCSGSFVLANAGLLQGHRATTAWWLCDIMAQQYPDITVDRNALIVRSGRYLTAGGSSAYQDAALALIRALSDDSTARLTAKYWMADLNRLDQSAFRLESNRGGEALDLLKRARYWIKQHLASEISIADMAEALDTTPRSLLRHLRKEADCSPQTLIQSMRVARSKVLLETTDLAVSDIAQRCGYTDESAFRRVFQRHCGLSPHNYRTRFNAKYHCTRQTP